MGRAYPVWRIRFVARYYRERTFDPEIGWKQFADKQNIRSRFRIPAWVWQVAAACLLLASYGIYRMIGQQQPEWVVITADAGQGKEVFLPDSSQVSLAAFAELRYDAKRYGKENRQVELKGKAFYQVKHRENLPFRVQTHLGNVVVLGTSFLVRELQNQMEVQVLQGRVRMAAGKKQPVNRFCWKPVCLPGIRKRMKTCKCYKRQTRIVCLGKPENWFSGKLLCLKSSMTSRFVMRLS